MKHPTCTYGRVSNSQITVFVYFVTLSLEHLLMSGLPDLMCKVAEEEMETFEGRISACSVVYYPQVIVRSTCIFKYCVILDGFYELAWIPTVCAKRRSRGTAGFIRKA